MAIRLRQVVVVLFLCALAIVGLEGQSSAPQSQEGVVIEGMVVDSSNGVIPGATVALEQGKTVVARTVSDSSGNFRFTAVKPGEYVVRCSLQGFKTVVTPVKAATKPNKLRVVLQIAGLSETVEVRSGTDVVRTQSATVTSTISAEQLAALPTASRNALSFVTLLPGVATGDRSSTIAGLPQNTINITVDGVVGTQFVQSGDQFYAITGTRAPGTESYSPIVSHPFRLTSDDPLSTFAADVDTASYANVRRFLSNGQLPPADAVRVEELVNYFRFAYPEPAGRRPVSITGEVGDCPWAPTHKLALIGVRAKSIEDRDIKGRNIVLLVDVSGSMSSPDKLPLVKTGLRMFVDTLRNDDRIAIVVYAGASGIALPSTSGEDRGRIHAAIENLNAGGSTNGGEGLVLAYNVATENFIKGGINRVILATDGDFNVGVTSQGDLLQLIEPKKQSGVFLSVLGVGTGNLKDSTMEMLADKGNGHYAYLDSLQEARRVLVREGGATPETVAKDVKFQVEFHPAQVAAWRLIGYENRQLAHQDFNNDKKDGGELGAGHSVTVLYEIVPVGVPFFPNTPESRPAVDPLRYQPGVGRTEVRFAGSGGPETGPPYVRTSAYPEELLTVKIRYKQPDGDLSELMEQPIRRNAAAPHVAFAAAVAEFGLLLRDAASPATRWDPLAARVNTMSGAGTDAADRQSFRDLVELAAGLKRIR